MGSLAMNLRDEGVDGLADSEFRYFFCLRVPTCLQNVRSGGERALCVHSAFECLARIITAHVFVWLASLLSAEIRAELRV